VPTITAGAELTLATGPLPKVTVYIDGQRAASVGPFHDWRTAERVALELNDALALSIRATVRNWAETVSELTKKT
jgi:hypothetical protein